MACPSMPPAVVNKVEEAMSDAAHTKDQRVRRLMPAVLHAAPVAHSELLLQSNNEHLTGELPLFSIASVFAATACSSDAACRSL
jgi:hypothetical protein